MIHTTTEITSTEAGYPIKDLKWNQRDNIFVGLVKDPLYGRPDLYDGFVSVQWNKQGKPLKVNKGRKELILPV